MVDRSKEPGDYGDFLLACEDSGLVRILDSTLLKVPFNGPAEVEAAKREVLAHGVDAKIVGRPCPACYRGDVRTCQYRPLRGPLFVPR